MTALTERKLADLNRALAQRDVFGDYSLVARLAIAHLTPGADVVRDLTATGVMGSSARRMAAAAEEVLGPRPPDPEHVLRKALGVAVHHLEHPDTAIPANRVRQLRQLAGVALAEGGTGFDRGMEGSARAAAKWTDDEVKAVDDAILAVARRKDEAKGWGDFTADDIWTELGDGFLVTKGLSGRLVAAANRGVIYNTDRTVLSTREGEHGHSQKLTVWHPAGDLYGGNA